MAEYLSDKEQEERLKTLIKKHGLNVLIAILLGLSAFFGFEYWQKSKHVERAQAASDFQALVQQGAALNAEADPAQTDKFLGDVEALVTASPNSVFALQALFLQAQYYVESGKLDDAQKTLEQAARLNVDDAGMKNIALLRLAQVQLSNSKASELDKVITTLGKINDAAFEPSKQELLGDVYVLKNDTKKATESYQKAWQTLKERDEVRVGLRLKMESLGLKPEPIEIPSLVNEPVAGTMMQAASE